MSLLIKKVKVEETPMADISRMRLDDQETRERLIYLSTRGVSVQLHMIFQPQTSPGFDP